MSSIIVSIILLGILVIVHEWGHYIVAKKSGILVEEFAVGMGPKIYGVQKGETLYTIRALPLGGFCRMEGEAEEEGKEISTRSFTSKSVLVRFAVIVAGPVMNFILAFIMLLILSATTYIAVPVLSDVVEDSPAQEAGLLSGDKITNINGTKINIYDELQYKIFQSGGETLKLKIMRNKEVKEIIVTPKFDEERNGYLVGIVPEVKGAIIGELQEGMTEKASLFETIHYSFFSMFHYVKTTALGLLEVFTFTADSDDYGGPITIIQTVGQSYEAGLSHSFWAAIQNLLQLGAVLSANLGVLNLFPIPALDGGRLLFIIIEAIRRKPMSMELEGRINLLGFAFIMGLMAFILYGDIVKIFQ